MSYKCDFCPGRTFKSQAALKSHQTQKKCNERQRRNISPSNPFLKFFKKKSTPKSYPLIEEPNAESILPIAKKRERFHKRKFIESDLKITDSVVAEDANLKSAEYRETIRRHFDELELQFPSLTCAAYARANRPRLTERAFHRWYSATWREEDRKKISSKLSQSRRERLEGGTKPDINKAERTRFTNEEKYGFILEWESAERENQYTIIMFA